MSAFEIGGTAKAINDAIEAHAEEPYASHGIGAGSMAHPCLRKTWYDFRRVRRPERKDARILRIFETGNIYEDRLLSYLEMIPGAEVLRDDGRGKQFKIALANGWLRGKLDGRMVGVPEAPKTEHIVECKSMKAADFKELAKKRLRKAKEDHFCQVQLYMHATGTKRALYVCACKDDDQIYVERVEYDAEYAIKMESRAEAIVGSDVPPPKLHDNPDARDALECKWCDHRNICHQGGMPKSSNCRTCRFSTPIGGEKPHFYCTLHEEPLSWEAEREGCGQHLFMEALIPGEVVEVDIVNHRIVYALRDGREWIDGASDFSVDGRETVE